ncbi:hypothetical protein [Aeromicrobium sp. 179-A 4D2 NHS]|uniref:hypothetical protein n=1 Tax=Aeromicrobium sp. 179-A 4D2 NHS TaxID=3142375 RepID=UPI0039A1C2E0
MNDMRGHNAVKGKQGFQPVAPKPEPTSGLEGETLPEGLIFDRRGDLISPNACRLCQFTEVYHPRLWIDGHGSHGFIAPDDALRLERMKARRAARA